MTESVNLVYESIDEQYKDESAATRRQLVGGAAGVLGGMGLLALLPDIARASHDAKTEDILNIAATAEVLATIVNTVGPEKVALDDVTRLNLQTAAREELIHYQVLTSRDIGGKAVTKRIWVPDSVFASKENLLKTLVAGDQIFINAYLIGVTSFGNDGQGKLARYAAEFMGVEAVHRALALQSLGAVGNDRAFMKYSQPEQNPVAPLASKPGFRRIGTAVTYLESAGFGFGKEGATPGRFYEFDEVSKRTPDPGQVNTRTPR